MPSFSSKASTEEIRARFDKDVERFSNLETGQSATVDAPLVLDLIANAAAAVNPNATSLLDLGCGAGNYSLKLQAVLPSLTEFTMIDFSGPMVERAKERLQAAGAEAIEAHQADIREFEFGQERFDIVCAAAVLHHLRGDDEWKRVFQRVYQALRPGGSFWISDLIEHTMRPVQEMMWERYGDYLAAMKGPDYRAHVFAYVRYEDTPRPLMFQFDLLRECGFRSIDILHKNSCFAAFGALK